MSESPPRWQEMQSDEPASGIVLSPHAAQSRRLIDQEVGTGESRLPTDPAPGVVPTKGEEVADPIPAAASVTPSDPPSSLVISAVHGEAKATRALLATVGRQVRGACRSILGSGHPDLEDTIQECFVGLVRALPAYRFEGAFSHYALRIAVRTALGARRRAHVTRAREELEQAPGDDVASPSIAPSDQTLSAERRELLRRLFDELPVAQAQALVMRILFDLSIEEIASASSVSVNTVKTRLRLAKDSLRRRIAGDPSLATALGGPR
jgi:RNA polymerase sigma factor (sigma-70 family)